MEDMNCNNPTMISPYQYSTRDYQSGSHIHNHIQIYQNLSLIMFLI